MDVSAVEPFTNVACPSCGEATRVKREFGPYTLSRRHAIGGMSLVFVAEDATLGREVIVKILNKEYSADEKRISAFEEEARITASFSHPNVVRVFTTGRAFDRFYIAMEFVTGGHFEQHITDRGMIPEVEALELALDVVAGLKAAKAAGLIHRDVKPGNVLIDGNGSAKLVDFGLALVTKGGKATATEIWATPYYVPPETIEGAEEDFRSDMYAFGATMYHALAGKPPCNEESMDTKRLRAAKQQIQPLHRAASWLHPETCAVIDRCMAYSPGDRYRSYNVLRSDLQAALKSAGSGVPPPPKTAAQAAGSLAKRSSGGLGQKLALASAILVVLVAVAFSAKLVLENPRQGKGGANPPDNGGGGVVVGSSGNQPSSDPSSSGSLEVAKLYGAASAAVAEGNFSDARAHFTAVRDHPKVLEPTGSWAAVEAVIAAYLEGDSEGARAEMRRAKRHIREAKGLKKGLENRLADALAAVDRFPPVAFPGDDVKWENEALLVAMLSGLKNWDQGLVGKATPFFEVLSSKDERRSPSWVRPYMACSKRYLNDAKRLGDAEPKDFRMEPSLARSLADELERVYNELETKGRAPFNVRCWQLQLERLARKGDGKRSPNPQAGDLTALDESLRECRFSEAIGMLREWQPDDWKGRERRKVYMQLVQAAQTFLAELGESAGEIQAEIPMKSRDGREFVKVVNGTVHHLSLRNADGQVSKLGWPEIDPESLIALHRECVKGGGQDLSSLRRHEHAVAFDFLSGNRTRALSAAERLSEVSELFGRRWQAVTAIFGE